MHPLAALAVKTIGAGTAAALISLGVAGVLAQAATPNPNPTAGASTKHVKHDHPDRRAIALAIIESEADVLHLTPAQLRQDLKRGQTVADLAKDRGTDKDKFAAALTTNLKPRLAALVGKGVITQTQADKVLDRITKGHIPFWNDIHHHKASATRPAK